MDNGLDLEYDCLLGEGAYGKVFLVKQQDGQQFAVKEIDLSRCDEGGRDQALKESALLSRLNHDHIIRYVESVITDDCLYIVTEFCAGGDIDEYIQTCAKQECLLPESLVSEWVLQIGEALKYLHEKKILHRDMKTKNLFLQKDFTVKLGDLGIAKVLDLNQTKADTFIGTPSYMSPELFTGKPYNHKTDIWGLGCCAYEMLTLKRAFQGKALWTIIREIKNGKVLELPDTYSLELRTLIQDMMSQDPSARPSAREIAQNDLLRYHMGASLQDTKDLPIPNEITDEVVTRRKPSTLTGSFNKMLRQKGASEDEKYRNSIANVSEKLNTLRSTNVLNSSSLPTLGNDEEFETFVYHGDDTMQEPGGMEPESTMLGEGLEAQGTMLDGSALQEYTRQLDTLVPPGSDSDPDSDYSTGGALPDYMAGGDELGTCDAGLLRQYSQTLGDRESREESPHRQYGLRESYEEVGKDVNTPGAASGRGEEFPAGLGHGRDVGTPGRVSCRPEEFPVSGRPEMFATPGGHAGKDKGKKSEMADKGDDSGWDSPHHDVDMFEETLEMPVKYKKYLGLKDTFQLSSAKRRKDVRDVLGFQVTNSVHNHNGTTPSATHQDRTKYGAVSEHKPKRDAKQTGRKFRDNVSLSSSFSGHESRTVDRPISLSRTLSADQPSKPRGAKVPVCERISESVKNHNQRHHTPPKQAVQSNISPDSVLNVDGVMSHLRDNLTSVWPDGTEADELLQTGGSDHTSEGNKVKKKKQGYLKKQSQAKKESTDVDKSKMPAAPGDEVGGDVRLYTRAQQVRFTKDEDDRPTPPDVKVKGMQTVLDRLCEDDRENLNTMQILSIQQELAAGIGVENLKTVLEIMSMVQDDQEMKLHMTNILGARLFADFETHLVILRLLEDRGVANRTLNTHI